MGAMASLGPMDLTGKIYVGDHQTLFHSEYITCGPHGLRAFFFHKSMGDIDPLSVASFDARGLIGRKVSLKILNSGNILKTFTYIRIER